MSLTYLECPCCGNKIKKFKKFGDYLTAPKLVCDKCKSEFKPSGFFSFFTDSMIFFDVLAVIIFMDYIQEILFSNRDGTLLPSFLIAVFVYFAVWIVACSLIPYKQIKSDKNLDKEE